LVEPVVFVRNNIDLSTEINHPENTRLDCILDTIVFLTNEILPSVVSNNNTTSPAIKLNKA
jgi:hypothetical protein